ncbi:hypothetical protein D3C86_1674560 [compost metagenome]
MLQAHKTVPVGGLFGTGVIQCAVTDRKILLVIQPDRLRDGNIGIDHARIGGRNGAVSYFQFPQDHRRVLLASFQASRIDVIEPGNAAEEEHIVGSTQARS